MRITTAAEVYDNSKALTWPALQKHNAIAYLHLFPDFWLCCKGLGTDHLNLSY
ncbi:hypothetical protein [Almyronema epifaneia]|uniref:Uncharacterized protein n=1 Tax=Almyronema epifaneia S1 TaxID=2991925 RepID=A0ABW6IJM7_9CYAN